MASDIFFFNSCEFFLFFLFFSFLKFSFLYFSGSSSFIFSSCLSIFLFSIFLSSFIFIFSLSSSLFSSFREGFFSLSFLSFFFLLFFLSGFSSFFILIFSSTKSFSKSCNTSVFWRFEGSFTFCNNILLCLLYFSFGFSVIKFLTIILSEFKLLICSISSNTKVFFTSSFLFILFINELPFLIMSELFL